MAKLQNISGLLVAISSDYTKDVAVTTKTTRAELTKMLQATESALAKALPRMEGYVSKVEDLELKNLELEEQKAKLGSDIADVTAKYEQLSEEKDELKRSISELEAALEVEKAIKKSLLQQIDKLTKRSFFERLFNK